MPAFSRHLVLAAGFSLRLVIPEEVKEAENETYRYTPLRLRDDEHSFDQFLEFIEFGVAVKYLL